MTRRFLRWAAVLLVLAAVGLAGVRWVTTSAPGVTPANFSRIAAGMTEPQCIQRLGTPDRTSFEDAGPILHWSEPGQRLGAWVNFDASGRVESGLLATKIDDGTWGVIDLLDGRPTPVFTRIRRWFGL